MAQHRLRTNAVDTPPFVPVTDELVIKISGANIINTLAIANGGTGATTASAAFNALSPMTTLGDLIYGGTSGAGTSLAGNTSATRQFLSQTGTGSASAAPTWVQPSSSDLTDGANMPSSGQKDALAGTSGTPSSTNKYVTDSDSRLSDSRAPNGDSVRVTPTTNQTITAGNSAMVNFDSEVFKTNSSMHSNTVNNTRLTAPIAGKYLVIANFSANNSGTPAGAFEYDIIKNGSTEYASSSGTAPPKALL